MLILSVSSNCLKSGMLEGSGTFNVVAVYQGPEKSAEEQDGLQRIHYLEHVVRIMLGTQKIK